MSTTHQKSLTNQENTYLIGHFIWHLKKWIRWRLKITFLTFFNITEPKARETRRVWVFPVLCDSVKTHKKRSWGSRKHTAYLRLFVGNPYDGIRLCISNLVIELLLQLKTALILFAIIAQCGFFFLISNETTANYFCFFYKTTKHPRINTADLIPLKHCDIRAVPTHTVEEFWENIVYKP